MYSISREQGVVASVALAGAAAFGTTAAHAAPAPNIYSWTGVNLGVESVWGETHNQFSHPVINGSSETSFGGLGVTAGYNWQFLPNWVASVGGFYDRNVFSGAPSLINGITIRAQSDWQAGVQGRVGFLFTPQVLVFGTGGYQWKNEQIIFATGASDSKTVGQTFVGGGLEYAVSPLIHLVAEVTVSQNSNTVVFFGDLPGTFNDITAKAGIDVEIPKRY